MRILPNKEYESMKDRGWIMKLPAKSRFTVEEKEALEQKYKQVKYYYMTTAIRGYYNDIALVK